MNAAALSLATLLAGASCEAPKPVEEGPPFARAPETFATPAACVAHLASLVKASAPPAFDRAVGPYPIAPGDVRAHLFRTRGAGHEIEEYRCLGPALESRRWSRGVGDVKPFTMDDIGNMSFPD